jgi:hypothetical protein
MTLSRDDKLPQDFRRTICRSNGRASVYLPGFCQTTSPLVGLSLNALLGLKWPGAILRPLRSNHESEVRSHSPASQGGHS